ncbi:MAG: DegT/DnrJ/EryC1/StrS family aminotransferase [Steroidobacteraceae bacterium]
MTAKPTDPEAPVFVTRPALPPLDELLPLLQQIWQNRIVTNGGPMLQQFEAALADYIDCPHISIVANATLGLMLALRHAGVTGEVITTPFSFVATSHAALWNGARPVFVDIDPATLNIDPAAIERALTPATQAILAVHCFGRACDLDAIESIARPRGIRVIYDAAHAFGVTTPHRNLLAAGDLSVLSFHGTKVFNTFEGGAIVSASRADKLAIDRLVNYGIVEEGVVETTGFNAKMSEFGAALGLVQLRHVAGYIAARAALDTRYRELLDGIPGVSPLPLPPGQAANYYAFPILLDRDFPLTRDQLQQHLRSHGIMARRYFHPALSELPMYRQFAPQDPQALRHSRDTCNRILVLPLYHDLAMQDVARIARLIRTA